MSQGLEATASTILLIEADTSLRRLISLGLRHRGVQVIETGSLTTLPISDNQLQPDLLVLDVDSGVRSNWELLEAVQAHPTLSSLPVVILAWEPDSANAMSPVKTTTQYEMTCLTKPFDARALHKTVEQLLSARAARKAAMEARAEAILLASYTSHTAPSIWPFITAAGLLLAVIGMLFQLAITVIGILIVIIALLCWTLGTKPESGEVAIT
ncbi:MAG TPA: hypothetical protein VFB12_23660 [Ktedonobacteraceae bacterium]|nr:hypothetical protein [Ktedonobacteraceae bacterium]